MSTSHRPSFDDAPPTGIAEQIAPGLRRLLAPNPSPMCYWGTNTYLLGTQDIAVIDPGPASDAHLSAILSAIPRGARISHIFVTHSHLDHSPLARPLAQHSGAPVLAFGPAQAGRSAIMAELAAAGDLEGGEGIDHDFTCDIALGDGQSISSPEWTLTAHHTPGHIGNHLCFSFGNQLFSGDHVMGWASSLVSPPDGDLTDFMASCRRLRIHPWHRMYPGHGAPIDAPSARLDWLIAHRQNREEAILALLAQDGADANSLTRAIYADVAPALLPAAERNVLAHLVDLTQRGLIHPESRLSATARFQRREI